MTQEDRTVLNRAYHMLRTARISALYYENRLWWAGFWHILFEITIVATTSSGIAAWAIWKGNTGVKLFHQDIGILTWALLTGASTLVAVLKPIFAPAKHIETATRRHQGWYSFFFAVDKMILTI